MIDQSRLLSEKLIVVTFGDVKEARQAMAAAHINMPTCTVMPYTPRDVAVHRGEGDGRHVSNHDAEILVTIFYEERLGDRPAGPVISALGDVLHNFGPVKAVVTLPASQPRLREFRVEFFDNQAAGHALTVGQIEINVSIAYSGTNIC